MLGGQSPELRLVGIGIIASILAGLVILLYFVIWRAARHSGEEFNSYVVRNFRYARLLSYLSDLMMKFGAVALVMLAGHPEWIAPLLLAFTGDYLVQGRLFTLPTRMAVILGAICIGAGFFQFIAGLEQLLVPLIVFSVIACFSTGRLIHCAVSKATKSPKLGVVMAANELINVHPSLFDRVRLGIMAHLSLAKKSGGLQHPTD